VFLKKDQGPITLRRFREGEKSTRNGLGGKRGKGRFVHVGNGESTGLEKKEKVYRQLCPRKKRRKRGGIKKSGTKLASRFREEKKAANSHR